MHGLRMVVAIAYFAGARQMNVGNTATTKELPDILINPPLSGFLFT